MTIELTPEHQRIVESAVHSGAYHNVSDFINAAIEAFGEKAPPSAPGAQQSAREAAIERLRTFGKMNGLSLNGMTLRQLRGEARP